MKAARLIPLLIALTLAGCASKPLPPDPTFPLASPQLGAADKFVHRYSLSYEPRADKL